MRLSITVIRFLVGLLFILSGLVKANDPLGLSYKMQEFFEIWNAGLQSGSFFAKDLLIGLFSSLHAHSLALSVLMIGLEIIAGAALLLGWRKNFILNLLFLLILFFTFLTAYAYGSGKFKNCGCFGDCLPITPLTSLVKDLVLLVLILFLLWKRRLIEPYFTHKGRAVGMILSVLFAFGLQWYVLNYLPLVDCLPFRKGYSIQEGMKIPTGALPDSFAIRFLYEKGGKEFEFSPEELPADLNAYTFKKRTDKLIRKGNAEPPIKGLSFRGISDVDSTAIILQRPEVILLFCENFREPVAGWIDAFKKLYGTVQGRIPVYVAASASLEEASAIFRKHGMEGVPVFTCDNTVVRSAARTNPTLYYLKEGRVQEKWSKKGIGKAVNHFSGGAAR